MTLRARLLIGLALVSVVLWLVVLLVPRTVERAQISELDRQLCGVAPEATSQFEDVSMRPPAPDESFSDLYIALVREDGARVVFVESQLASGRSPSFPPGPATTELTFTTIGSAGGAAGMWRAATVAGPERGSVVLVATPLDRVGSTTANVRWALLAGGGAVLAVLVVIGWWVIRLGLRPIAEVTKVADAIAAGQRDRRAESHAGNTEADRLAREVNSMLDQLVAVEDRLRVFVSDASHELRTPVTAIKGLVTTGLMFSLMRGIFHEYYTVALAPAVGAVAGIGATLTWRAIRNRRAVSAAATVEGVAAPSHSAPSWHAPFATVMLALAIGVSAWWSYTLLGRSADFLPWLRGVVLIGGLAAAVGALGLMRLPMRAATVIAGVALGATLAGSAAYAVQTASVPHTGSIPAAGPAVLGGFPGGAPGGLPGGGLTGANDPQPGDPAQAGGGMSGLLDAPTVADRMKALLGRNASSYTWVAATVGSQNAAGYQLATGDPVMAIGGFNRSDPAPTLEKFQQYVADRRIHYFIGGGDLDSWAGGSDHSSQISEWVSANFTAQTVDDVTVYDLTQQH